MHWTTKPKQAAEKLEPALNTTNFVHVKIPLSLN